MRELRASGANAAMSAADLAAYWRELARRHRDSGRDSMAAWLEEGALLLEQEERER